MDKKINPRSFAPILSVRELKKALQYDSSARSLLFSNLFTVIIALLEHWNLHTVLFIYWGQNVIIGFFNVLRLLKIKKLNYKENVFPAEFLSTPRFFLAGFFAVHYGLFHFVYLQFIGSPDQLDWKWVGISLFMFLLHHGFSFLRNFHNEKYSRDYGRLMFFPYIRIFPMHIIIIFGGFLMTVFQNEFADRAVLVFFLLLKTNADLAMHHAEHARDKDGNPRPRSISKHALLLFLLLSLPLIAKAQTIAVSPEESSRIAERIFTNECFSQDECLIEWNQGEEFLSLGIGHFIWYPQGQKGPFEESFLKYLRYAKACGEKIPDWLDATPLPACPWGSREDFLIHQKDPRFLELKAFLLATKSCQAAFLMKGLEDALPLVLANTAQKDHDRIIRQFNLLVSAPAGVYALVDYINFKGLGILESERYQSEGWGLLQVLSLMKEKDSARAAREEFVRAAKIALTRRVANAPAERDEQRWLTGWLRRLESYLPD